MTSAAHTLWILALAAVVILARFSVHTPHDLALDWSRSYEALVHIWAGYMLAMIFYRHRVQTKATPPLVRWLAAGAVVAATALEVAMWVGR